MNKLFFGDNLDVLREQIKDESVDLIYLDPPFNSQATYNILFKEGGRIPSEAQAEAFRDTWGWGESAAIAYDEVMRSGEQIAVVMRALRSWLGDTGLLAYLAMMAVRLIELRRVLKDDGSLYLHCDPTASHYLKILLDAIFGHQSFRNEIIWKRTSAHSAARRWGDVHDSLMFVTKSDRYVWNPVFTPYEPEYLARYKRKDANGIPWSDYDLTGPGVRSGFSGQIWRGFNPTEKNLHWKVSNAAVVELIGIEKAAKLNTIEKLDLLDENGRIHWPASGGFPRFKRYIGKGRPVQSVITDIPPLNSQAQERLGYPTQKPVALLDRIIRASSNLGSVVLDPFCGCGTSVEAAERLGRQWLGIDVTHYAITLIERRLKRLHSASSYQVHGRPTDLAGAYELARRDKYQFQWWASWLLGAQTYETKKGADRGIDGNIYFANGPFGYGRVIISVKGGEHLSPVMVRELNGVVQREGASMGVLVTIAEPTRAMLADAAGAGFVERSAHGRLPRVQVVTVADLLVGRLPKLPPLPVPAQTAPRSRRKQDRDQLELLLPIASGTPTTNKGEILDPRFLALAR